MARVHGEHVEHGVSSGEIPGRHPKRRRDVFIRAPHYFLLEELRVVLPAKGTRLGGQEGLHFVTRSALRHCARQ